MREGLVAMLSAPGPPGRHRSRLFELGVLAGLALAAVLVGLGIAAAAGRFGPWVVLVAAAAVTATAAVLRDLSWAVVGMFLTLPVGLLQAGPLQVVQLATLVVIGLAFAGSITGSRRRGVVSLRVGLSLGAVLMTGALSTAVSATPELSARALLQLYIGAGLMVATAATIETAAQAKRLVSVLVVVGAGISAAATLTMGQVTSNYGGAAVSGRADGIFSQPNELGAFTAAILVLATGLVVGSRTRAGWVTAFLAALAVLSALLASLSRGAWIGAVLGALAVVVMVAGQADARRRLRLVGQVLVVLTVAASVLVGDLPLTRVVGSRFGTFGQTTANPNDARPEIYDEALRLVLESPVLGHGPGAFVDLYAASVASGRSGSAEHAHNLALTLAVEFGLVGLAAFAALAAVVLTSGWRAVRTLQRAGHARDAALCAGAVGALITVLGHGLVDYPLRNPLLFLLHWAMAGMVLGYVRLALEHRPGPAGASTT